MNDWEKSNHPWIGKDIFSETVKHIFPKENEIIEEWGGSMRCITSDNRNVNIAEELNELEREKNDNAKNNHPMVVIYRPENYPGPIAIDIKPSKECIEYHKNSYVQINLNSELMEKYEKETSCPRLCEK